MTSTEPKSEQVVLSDEGERQRFLEDSAALFARLFLQQVLYNKDSRNNNSSEVDTNSSG